MAGRAADPAAGGCEGGGGSGRRAGLRPWPPLGGGSSAGWLRALAVRLLVPGRCLPPGSEGGFAWQLLPREGPAGGRCGSGGWLPAEAAEGLGPGMGKSVSGGMLLRYRYCMSGACRTVGCCCSYGWGNGGVTGAVCAVKVSAAT